MCSRGIHNNHKNTKIDMTDSETIRRYKSKQNVKTKVKDKYSDKINFCISSTGLAMSRKFDYHFVRIDSIFRK